VSRTLHRCPPRPTRRQTWHLMCRLLRSPTRQRRASLRTRRPLMRPPSGQPWTLPVPAAGTRTVRRRIRSAWVINAPNVPGTTTAQAGQVPQPAPPVAYASPARRIDTAPAQPRPATQVPTSASDASREAIARGRVRPARTASARRSRARTIQAPVLAHATPRAHAKASRGKPARSRLIARPTYLVPTATAAIGPAQDPVRLVT
jgi:hypothetical protein